MKMASVVWRWGQSCANRGAGDLMSGTAERSAGASRISVAGVELATAVTTSQVSAGTGEQVT
jgi:hypothetical protein